MESPSTRCDRVDALFGGKEGGLLFVGVITAVHNDDTYEVNYDDGDKETHVPVNLMLPEEQVQTKWKRRVRASCKHCGRSDHRTKASKLCPHNPHYVIPLEEQQHQAAAAVAAAAEVVSTEAAAETAEAQHK